MSDSTDADVEAMLEAQSAPRTGSSTEEGFDSDVEVAFTIWGTRWLTRGKEIQEFDDRDQLARFLWAECRQRTDSLALHLHLGYLRLNIGPYGTCRVISHDAGAQPA